VPPAGSSYSLPFLARGDFRFQLDQESQPRLREEGERYWRLTIRIGAFQGPEATL